MYCKYHHSIWALFISLATVIFNEIIRSVDSYACSLDVPTKIKLQHLCGFGYRPCHQLSRQCEAGLISRSYANLVLESKGPGYELEVIITTLMV